MPAPATHLLQHANDIAALMRGLGLRSLVVHWGDQDPDPRIVCKPCAPPAQDALLRSAQHLAQDLLEPSGAPKTMQMVLDENDLLRLHFVQRKINEIELPAITLQSEFGSDHLAPHDVIDLIKSNLLQACRQLIESGHIDPVVLEYRGQQSQLSLKNTTDLGFNAASGQIEAWVWHPKSIATNPTITKERISLQQAIKNLAQDLIRIHHPGACVDLGGGGEIIIDPATACIEMKSFGCAVENQSATHIIVCDAQQSGDIHTQRPFK